MCVCVFTVSEEDDIIIALKTSMRVILKFFEIYIKILNPRALYNWPFQDGTFIVVLFDKVL